MARSGKSNATIREWDIEKSTQDQFKADLLALVDYYHANYGDPRGVARKIRPVLETYTRIVGGTVFAGADTLGTITAKLRGAGPTQVLFDICDDLEELNDYSKRYYHGENQHAATEPISEAELHAYVKRTLGITGSC